MTLDTSAVLAVLQNEVERSEFVSLIEQSSRRIVSAVVEVRSYKWTKQRKRKSSKS